MDINDQAAREVDADLSNKFKWSWLEEEVEIQGDIVKFGCFKKLYLPGKVLCTLCTDVINYASNGKKALSQHVKKEKHLKIWRAQKDSMKLEVTEEGIFTSPLDDRPRVVPLCDRIASQKVLKVYQLSCFNK